VGWLGGGGGGWESCHLWDEVVITVEPDSPQMTIWLMRIAYCIPTSTNTHSEFVIFLLFHGYIGYTKASQCYVIRTVHRLSCL